MKTITQLINLHGGLSALAKTPIRIENEPWMRLVIEHIGEGPSGFPMISVAHYGEQNGDPMRDPEITFQLVTKTNPRRRCEWHKAQGGASVPASRLVSSLAPPESPSFYPVEFLNDYAGFRKCAIWREEDGRILSNPRLAREIMDFTRLWNRNIRDQGFIRAYQRSVPPHH